MSEIEIESPERKLQASIELANAYREMMSTFAWKHLQGVVIAGIKSDTNHDLDQMPIAELTVGHVAEARGIRKAFERIEAELNWILQGNTPITRR